MMTSTTGLLLTLDAKPCLPVLTHFPLFLHVVVVGVVVVDSFDAKLCRVLKYFEK